MSVRRYVFAPAALLAIALTTAVVGVPTRASAFCCRAVRSIRLQPVDPTVTVRGTAEIDECFGLAFLLVRVNGRVSDGTTFIPAFRGTEPLLGEWFTMTGGHGETLWEGISAASAAGRTLEILDQNYSTVLSGQF